MTPVVSENRRTRHSIGAIVVLSAILMMIYFAWLATALVLYLTIFGNLAPESLSEFVRLVFATPSGWTLITVGSAIGLVFAVVVLAIAGISIQANMLQRDKGKD